MAKRAGKLAAIGAGLAIGSLALSPALSAVHHALGAVTSPTEAKVSLKMLGSIGSFTPVTRDERLAKAYAIAARNSQSRGFRFTPTSGSPSGERSLTVLVRAGTENAAQHGVAGLSPNLGVEPIAFNLRLSKGLDRFANEPVLQAQTATRELPIAEPAQLPTANFVLKSKPSRFSSNLQVEARPQTAAAPTSNTPQTLGSEKSYSVDLSSSYSLTRNLNVQAGLRYRGPDNRLVPLTDQQKDTQAVYLGTTFKF